MKSNRSNVKVGGLEPVEVHYYSIHEIWLIEERHPGWYSWFYVPDSLNSLSTNIIKKQKLPVVVKEGFKSGYSGDIVRFYEQSDCEVSTQEFSYLQKTLFAFSSPLYVGISKNLSSRLHTHVRQLKKCMSISYNYTEINDEMESDTDNESSYFAGRVSKVMKEEGLSIDNLYVKVVISDDEKKLKIVESYLNKILIPTYGVR